MLAALHDHYGADANTIGAVFGARGSGYGHLMSQAAWDEFKIIDLVAPQLLPDDVATLRTPGKKWGATSAESVTALQARGVRFLACDNTLAKWSRIIATERGGNRGADEGCGIRSDDVAGTRGAAYLRSRLSPRSAHTQTPTNIASTKSSPAAATSMLAVILPPYFRNECDRQESYTDNNEK